MKNLLVLFCCIVFALFHSLHSVAQVNPYGPYAKYYVDKAFYFRDSTKLITDDFLREPMLNSTMMISEQDELVPYQDRDLDSIGFHITRYMQYHQGYPIEATQVNVISRKGVVMHANGLWLPSFNLDVSTVCSESTALSSATAFIGAPKYDWQDPSLEAAVKIKIDTLNDTTFYDSKATLYPKGQLVVAHPYGDTSYSDTSKYALCWKFYITPMKWDTTIIDVGTDTTTIYDTVIGYRPMSPYIVYVNAATGSVYSCNNHLYSGMATAYVNPTYYCGNQTIGSSKQGWTYFLRDDDNMIFSFGSHIATSTWIEHLGWFENHWHQHTSPTAYWALQTANTYFKEVFGVNSSYRASRQDIYTDRDVYLNESRVGYFHADMTRILGEGNEDVDQYYFGYDNTSVAPSAAHLDIVCHEYMHALLRHGPNFDAYGETGSVAEGLCDYFGSVAASSISSVYNGNWTNGFGYQTNNFARHFSSPLADWPDASIEHYTNYAPGMDIHLAGGIFRKYTSILESGGTYYGTTVTGIGNQDYNNFRAIYGFFWNHQNYLQTRNQLLAYYEYVYGSCSPRWVSCARAWHALGVGPLPSCKKTFIITDGVAEANDNNVLQVVGHKHAVNGNQPGIAIGKTYDAASLKIISCKWSLPAEWNVSYNFDSTEISIDSVNSLTSRTVSCLVTYDDSTKDTVSSYMHFNDVTPAQKSVRYAAQSIAAERAVTLFPNPVKRQLNVQLNFATSKSTTISIWDLMGRQVYVNNMSGASGCLLLPELPSGFYICKVASENKEYITKMEVRN